MCPDFELRKAFDQKARIGVYTNEALVTRVMNELYEQIASTVTRTFTFSMPATSILSFKTLKAIAS